MYEGFARWVDKGFYEGLIRVWQGSDKGLTRFVQGLRNIVMGVPL